MKYLAFDLNTLDNALFYSAALAVIIMVAALVVYIVRLKMGKEDAGYPYGLLIFLSAAMFLFVQANY